MSFCVASSDMRKVGGSPDLQLTDYGASPLGDRCCLTETPKTPQTPFPVVRDPKEYTVLGNNWMGVQNVLTSEFVKCVNLPEYISSIRVEVPKSLFELAARAPKRMQSTTILGSGILMAMARIVQLDASYARIERVRVGDDIYTLPEEEEKLQQALRSHKDEVVQIVEMRVGTKRFPLIGSCVSEDDGKNMWACCRDLTMIRHTLEARIHKVVQDIWMQSVESKSPQETNVLKMLQQSEIKFIIKIGKLRREKPWLYAVGGDSAIKKHTFIETFLRMKNSYLRAKEITNLEVEVQIGSNAWHIVRVHTVRIGDKIYSVKDRESMNKAWNERDPKGPVQILELRASKVMARSVEWTGFWNTAVMRKRWFSEEGRCLFGYKTVTMDVLEGRPIKEGEKYSEFRHFSMVESYKPSASGKMLPVDEEFLNCEADFPYRIVVGENQIRV